MNWFSRFMLGRYGTDQLTIAILICYFTLELLAQLFRWPALAVLALLFLVAGIYRIFSRNINRRYRENVQFLNKWKPIKNKCKNFWSRTKDSQTHKYYKCPNCKNTLRVPRGRGKIEITCPVCGTDFIKKT